MVHRVALQCRSYTDSRVRSTAHLTASTRIVIYRTSLIEPPPFGMRVRRTRHRLLPAPVLLSPSLSPPRNAQSSGGGGGEKQTAVFFFFCRAAAVSCARDHVPGFWRAFRARACSSQARRDLGTLNAPARIHGARERARARTRRRRSDPPGRGSVGTLRRLT